MLGIFELVPSLGDERSGRCAARFALQSEDGWYRGRDTRTRRFFVVRYKIGEHRRIKGTLKPKNFKILRTKCGNQGIETPRFKNRKRQKIKIQLKQQTSYEIQPKWIRPEPLGRRRG